LGVADRIDGGKQDALVAETLERPQAGLRIENLPNEPLHIARLSAASQMAAALTHDLNQPLTAIINSVNAAKRLLAHEVQSGYWLTKIASASS
jgi:C4-dicarboxylate-specific signal transduction histidine kinase